MSTTIERALDDYVTAAIARHVAPVEQAISGSAPTTYRERAALFDAIATAAEERERALREALATLVALFPKGATLFCDGKTVMEKLHPDHEDAVPRFHHATDCRPCAVLKSARAALALGTGKGGEGG